MPETTPTQRSAHLVQGNSSASRPGLHMPAEDLPVTMEQDAWDWITDLKNWIADMANAAVDLAALLVAVAIVAGLAGAAYRFLTN